MLLKIHTCAPGADRGACTCKVYPLVGLEEFKHILTLRQQIALQRELTLTNISSARTFADVCALVLNYMQLPPNEARPDHPESVFLTGAMTWATRISAGDDITLLEALDVQLENIDWYREDGDPDPLNDEEGQQRVGKRRQASVQADVPPPPTRRSGSKATSKQSKKR